MFGIQNKQIQVRTDLFNSQTPINKLQQLKAELHEYQCDFYDQTHLQSMNKNYDYVFKVILIGSSSSKKSQILLKFQNPSPFKQQYPVQIGVQFVSRTLQIQNYQVKMQIWDTAGQEAFRSIFRSFYRGVSGIVLVYNITDRQSFTDISKYGKEVQQQANPDVVKILVGNRCHLNSLRQVSYEEGVQLMKKHQIHYFLEASAEQNINVEQIFVKMAKYIKKRVDKNNDEKNNAKQIKKGHKEQSEKPTMLTSALNFIKKPFLNESKEIDIKEENTKLKKRVKQLEDELLKQKSQRKKIQQISENSRVAELQKKNKQLMKKNLILRIKLQKSSQNTAKLNDMYSQIIQKMEQCTNAMNLYRQQSG